MLVTIYSEDKDGNIIITFDSRWQYPELLGYKPDDPEYKLLRSLWKQAMREDVLDKETADEPVSALHQSD